MQMTIWVTAFACAIMAGTYFAFSSFVMNSLAVLPRAQGIAAMQSINRVILSSSFMVLFFGSAAASLGLGVWGIRGWGDPGSMYLVGGSLLYVVGMVVCTAAFNVPLNDGLEALDPAGTAAVEVWATYLRDWTRYNHVRTFFSAAASAVFVTAAWVAR
ncbi:MAG: DUF1772 domain-containing protein [Nannocystales bacterium]